MKTPEHTIEGLLTDYALGEITDPEKEILIESLLEADSQSQELLREIRSTLDLVEKLAPVAMTCQSEHSMIIPISIATGLSLAAAAIALIMVPFPFLHPQPKETDMAKSKAPLKFLKVTMGQSSKPERLTRRGGSVPWDASQGSSFRINL